jgi:hypothetical protein
MRGCDNSKIHISSNLLLSICLLIMLDTLLLVPSLHCNTSLHFTTSECLYCSNLSVVIGHKNRIFVAKYCHLCSVWLYQTFSHYLINGMVLGTNYFKIKRTISF